MRSFGEGASHGVYVREVGCDCKGLVTRLAALGPSQSRYSRRSSRLYKKSALLLDMKEGSPDKGDCACRTDSESCTLNKPSPDIHQCLPRSHLWSGMIWYYYRVPRTHRVEMEVVAS